MIKKNIVFSCYPEIKENFSGMKNTNKIEPVKREVDGNKITPDDIKFYLRKLFELYKDTYKTGDEILTNYIKGCILEAINIIVNKSASEIKLKSPASNSIKAGNILATNDIKIREENERINKLEEDRKIANKALNMAIIKIQKDKVQMKNIENSIIETIKKDILNETTNKQNAEEILKLARIGVLKTNAGSIDKMVSNLGNNLLKKIKDLGMGNSVDSIYDKFYNDNKDDLERLEIKRENVLTSIINVTENTLSLAKDEGFCKKLFSNDVSKEDIQSGNVNILDQFFKCYTDLEIGSKVSFGLVGLGLNESFLTKFSEAIDNWVPLTEVKKPVPQIQEPIKIGVDKINQVNVNAPKLFCFKTNDHFTCFSEVTVIENGKTSILR
jgi:hypothetical protein